MGRVPVIKTVNLCKYYEMGKNVVKALDHINFEVYSGELIIIFGPSGCGKSTLMHLIAGLDEPTSGEIYIRGEKLSGKNAKELAQHRRTKIGLVFQQFNLINTMNIIENVALPLAFNRISKRRRFKRAETLIEAIGLSSQKNHTPSELSGGQQQKLAIARALVANPWILLADEPTGNIDSRSADEVIKLLVILSRKSKRTILIITHNPDYLKYADRLIYLKDGKIIKIRLNRRVKGIGEEAQEWLPSLKATIYEEEKRRKEEKGASSKGSLASKGQLSWPKRKKPLLPSEDFEKARLDSRLGSTESRRESKQPSSEEESPEGINLIEPKI